MAIAHHCYYVKRHLQLLFTSSFENREEDDDDEDDDDGLIYCKVHQ